MLAKVTEAHLNAIGAKDVSEFSDRLTAYISNTHKLETAMADSPDLSAVIKRLDALEARPVFDAAAMTTAINAAVAGSVPAAMTAWAGSEGGKKLIGAEASRITAEAMAATGTVPVKPAPTPAAGVDDVEALEAAGKYEEAYAKSRNIQAEFPSAANYAAFRKNQHRVRIVTRAD